ncbi:MAG: 50S ribosomal protein L25 [Thermoleophilia bacterium]|nr:50S ribosomal protein L25 [Thermoleophilia bacterium]
MDTVKLPVMRREESGKGPARRLRKSGRLPAVVYSRGQETIPLSIDAAVMKTALSGGHNVVLELQYPDGKGKKHYAVVKEIQSHPTRHQILHLDLHEVDLRQEIEATVPIELVGDARGVVEGGVLDHQHREVTVRARPTEVPASLALDVSALGISDHSTVAALSPPAGVEILDDPQTLVVVIHPPRLAEELEEELEVGAEVAEAGEETATAGEGQAGAKE